MLALRENIKAKEVENKHFDKANESIRASITEDVIKYYQNVAKDLGSGIAKKDKSEKDIQYM